uniref:Uncharacterized protein n=1 Tax=Romanomermis culicivorax TaxID=13658 RepID=A0A915HL08_ROMCU
MSNLTDLCIIFSTTWEQYVVVLYTINHSNDSDYSNPFYTLITGTGIADLGMLLFNVYGILYDILGYRYLGGKLDSFLGFLLYWSLGWYGTQIFVVHMVDFGRWCAGLDAAKSDGSANLT